MRGSYERAGDYLRQASEAYGAHGTQTMRWYEWSLKVLGVKLAIRRGTYDEAVAQAEALVQTAGVPPSVQNNRSSVDVTRASATVASYGSKSA